MDAAGVAGVHSAGYRTRGAQNTKPAVAGAATQRSILTAGARGPCDPCRAAAQGQRKAAPGLLANPACQGPGSC